MILLLLLLLLVLLVLLVLLAGRYRGRRVDVGRRRIGNGRAQEDARSCRGDGYGRHVDPADADPVQQLLRHAPPPPPEHPIATELN